MPAVAKTSHNDVIAAARELLERDGVDGVSMQAVADEVGVRAPSLYKRFADRGALLGELERAAFADMQRALERVPVTAHPKRDLAALARAYRRFAKAHRHAYALMMMQPSSLPDADAVVARKAATQPVFARLVAWLGPSDVLEAARVLTAFVHGFVAMELAGAFHLGPGIDDAFDTGVTVLLRGLG
jgi:AcrR family transcriptional regulator